MNTLSSLLYFIGQSISAIVTNQTAKKVLASPNNATGKPSFRSLVASDITSGQFATDRIPSLDTSKIGSGVFPAARIPNLDASKITTGVLASARGGMSSAEKTKLNGIETGANNYSLTKIKETKYLSSNVTIQAGSSATLSFSFSTEPDAIRAIHLITTAQQLAKGLCIISFNIGTNTSVYVYNASAGAITLGTKTYIKSIRFQ